MQKNKFGQLYSNEFLHQVGLGLIPGHRRVTALGNNPDIDTAPEDIWTGGGLYPFASSAALREVVSASANDTAAGTGARTITIFGLDANYKEISETVTLNGTTAVATVNQYLRINSMLIMSAGTGETNAGDISLRDTGGGTVRSIIPAGYGITRQSVYTVPAGFTLSIISQVLSINRPSTTRDATVATFTRSFNGFYRMPLELSVDGNTYRHDGIPGITVTEKNDFCLRCTFVSATNTDITGAWLGVLIDNKYL